VCADLASVERACTAARASHASIHLRRWNRTYPLAGAARRGSRRASAAGRRPRRAGEVALDTGRDLVELLQRVASNKHDPRELTRWAAVFQGTARPPPQPTSGRAAAGTTRRPPAPRGSSGASVRPRDARVVISVRRGHASALEPGARGKRLGRQGPGRREELGAGARVEPSLPSPSFVGARQRFLSLRAQQFCAQTSRRTRTINKRAACISEPGVTSCGWCLLCGCSAEARAPATTTAPSRCLAYPVRPRPSARYRYCAGSLIRCSSALIPCASSGVSARVPRKSAWSRPM
jgi:hypothetical protein